MNLQSKTLTNLPPHVLQVLKELEHEEHSSNGRQGLLGKRVQMSKKMEKIIGVKSVIEADDLYDETRKHVVGEVEFVTQSEPFITGKEPVSYQRGKGVNRYKVREAS
jgi:hypothetical protein